MASRRVLERRNLLALYLARAIAFFQQQPQSAYAGPDTFDGTDAEGFPGGDERMTEGDKIAKQNEAFDIAEAMAPPTRRAAVQSDTAELELRILAPPRDVSAECGEQGLKPKRIRPPKTKLHACDVEAGALYVPKRGNDKTPRLRVVMVVMDESETPARVWFCRENEPDKVAVHPDGTPVADFLALVARRVA